MQKWTYFTFFFHKSIDLGNRNSIITFITTNYFITATGGKKLRGDFKSRTVVLKMINFNELKIFDSAKGQHNMVSILRKNTDTDYIAQNCITSKVGLAASDLLNNQKKPRQF
jgi:adenine-specific DNA-methyltransferase